MNKYMFLREEFLEKAGISEKELLDWEQRKLLKPVGITKDQVRIYSRETLDRILHIQKLQALGYQPEHIQKIIKKVGIPRSGEHEEPNENSQGFLTVGDLADRVGISPRAIKHWEDKGIIEPEMRSEGGFRLYSESYVYLCELIKDLQLFGYSLEEIKAVSDLFREFLALSQSLSAFSSAEAASKLESMTDHIQHFEDKMALFKSGMERWENLLKKKKREISGLKNQINKRRHKGAQKQVKGREDA
jgi:DNA-binding transcriptional MerR regulator